MFCEKPHFYSLFLVNLRVSYGISICLENIPYNATYSVKIGVWNDSKTMWDSFQISVLIQKTCLIYVSGALLVRAGLCLRMHVAWLCTQADSCMRMPRVSLVYFSKNRFICSLKVIFFILIFLKLI